MASLLTYLTLLGLKTSRSPALREASKRKRVHECSSTFFLIVKQPSERKAASVSVINQKFIVRMRKAADVSVIMEKRGIVGF